jgi:hypothetical protein
MTLNLTETTVRGAIVHMRLADHADPEKATLWVDFQLPVENLDGTWLLAQCQRAALQSALDAINDEIQRAQSVANRVRG